MKKIVIIAALLLATVPALAQTTPAPEDYFKANAPLAAFADSIGDQPNAHICAHRATMMMRVGRLRLASKSAADAKAALPPNDHDANTDEVVSTMYSGPAPKSVEDVGAKQFSEFMKCAYKYGLTKNKPN